MDLFVTFLGTAASVPTAARGTSATLIAHGGSRWLVDCGEGTQRQLLRSGLGLVDLDLVLVTHLHGDHYLGLPGLLKTYGLRGRERELVLVGPPGLVALVETLRTVFGRLPFPLGIEEVTAGSVARGRGVGIEAYPTAHGMRHSLGYRVVEDARPGAFDVAAAAALGVPEGPLFGRLQRGEEITLAGRVVRPSDVLGPARPGRRIVLTGDTRPCTATLEAAQGACLLVHEATLLDEDRERAAETHHSTALEAAELARAADVRLLALTHLSSRFSPRDARREAERAFERVVVPRDFDQVEVPFPERGEPRLLPAVEQRGVHVVHTSAAVSGEPATVPGDDL
jgi:ribonuclease Z